jgi:hypothetical protein
MARRTAHPVTCVNARSRWTRITRWPPYVRDRHAARSQTMAGVLEPDQQFSTRRAELAHVAPLENHGATLSGESATIQSGPNLCNPIFCRFSLSLSVSQSLRQDDVIVGRRRVYVTD